MAQAARAWGAGTPEADVIVARALQLIDDEGIAAFTTRRLATVMGIFQTVIYRKVSSRDELLDRVADLVLSEVTDPELDEANWQRWLEEFGVSIRAALLRHPETASLINTGTSMQPAMLRQGEQVLRVLGGAGFEDEDLLLRYLAYMRFVLGGSVVEVMPRPLPGESGVEGRAELTAEEAAQHPAVATARSLLATAVASSDLATWSEQMFRSSLRMLLTGFAGPAPA